MKFFLIIMSVLIALLTTTTNTLAQKKVNIPTPTLSHVERLDTIVAIVNNQIITEHQLGQAIGQAEQQMEAQNISIPNEKSLRKQVLNQIIYQILQLQFAKKLSIQISDEQLNDAISDIAKHNHLTMAQFRQSVIAHGINYKQYREEIRKQMTISELQQRAISSRIIVSNQEVQEYLNNYKQQKHADTEYLVRDILIPLPGTPSSQQVMRAQNETEKLMNQLHQGANFEKLATEHSGGKQALKGGDLGWNTLGGLPNIFSERLITMNPGDVAGPIRAANGFHIIKLVAVRNNTKKFSQDGIKKIIYQRNYNQQL